MKFTTDFSIPKHYQPIDYDSSVLMMGSCFSQNIGDKFAYYGFDVCVNPFGVIFNPHSLLVLIDKSLNDSFSASDVSGTFSYLAHSDLDGADAAETLEHLKCAGKLLKNRILSASHVIITLGTAWVYELNAHKEIVANCHQQPQNIFNKRLLTITEITQALRNIELLIMDSNPVVNIIYTLSPVRHIKDGMIENTRSKSRLHEALQQQCDARFTTYFPAYEILMDELRDYRFYAMDMIHPNELAVDYIWSRFRESVLNSNTIITMNEVEKYRKLQNHRPKNKQAHALQLRNSSVSLQQKFPNLKLQ